MGTAKKVLNTLTVLALAGGMLAGCSGGSSSTTSSSGTNASGTSSSSPPLKMKMVLPLFENVPDMHNTFWTAFQKKTNTQLDIEWVPNGDYTTKFNLILSSGNLPEVLWAPNVSDANLIQAINSGAFWDLTPFLGDMSKYPNLRDHSAPNAYRYTTYKGKIYGVPRNRPIIDQGILLRKDWLDKLGLQPPTTMDELANDLVAMGQNNVSGGQTTDGYVSNYITSTDSTGIDSNIAAGFGALNPTLNNEGGMMYYKLTPAYVQAVEWMRNLYARGGLPKEFSAIKQTQSEELYSTGQAAAYQRNIWRAYEFQQSIKKVQPNAQVIVVDPKGPSGQYAINLGTGIYGAFYISSKVPKDKVEQILKYFDFTNTDDFFNFIFFGQEGIDYNVVNGEKVMTDVGNKEIGTSGQQPVPLTFNQWWKSYDAAAPKAYNDAIWQQVQHFSQDGTVNPFDYVVSDTWVNTWPKYNSDWNTKTVEAIVGKISMDDYKKYVDSLNNNPDFKKAYQEFKQFYDQFWKK
ncbi:MAG: extracellular solute-binding protein family 1 [Bacilli bacterium]|nr:extracellular solute-binding protein family 1 [Bacilli bacterium]